MLKVDNWCTPLIVFLFIAQAVLIVGYLRGQPFQTVSDVQTLAKALELAIPQDALVDSTKLLAALPNADDIEGYKRKLNIAVVSITTEYSKGEMWEERPEYLKQILINHECYTHLHGYDNIFSFTDYVENMTMPKGPVPPRRCRGMCTIPEDIWGFVDAPMQAYWNKVYLARKVLKDYDYILWTDADVFFTDLAKPIEWFIDNSRMRGRDIHLWLPQDQGGAGAFIFSDAVYLVKNSIWGRYVLDAWWDYGTGKKTSCKDRWFRVQQPGHDMNLDMPWMWHAVLMLYDKYNNKKAPCMSECLNRTIANCFRNYFRDEQYPRAHKGPTLELAKGPIVFSGLEANHPLDTGLMLQGNWGPFQDDDHVDASFTIHSKPDRDPWRRYMKKVHRVCTDVLQCKANVTRDPETKEVSGSAHCDAFDKEVLSEARRRLQTLTKGR